jgi:hypothetical protein
LAINEAVTNAVVNISGGTLYCCRIGLDGTAGIPTNGSTDTLNISGGLIYVGFGGVGSNDTVAVTNQIQSVNISGGTFHTADMLQSGGGGGANGAITNVLSDGTNWTWGVNPPVNLTNSFPGAWNELWAGLCHLRAGSQPHHHVEKCLVRARRH